jgi:hypothetical protein
MNEVRGKPVNLTVDGLGSQGPVAQEAGSRRASQVGNLAEFISVPQILPGTGDDKRYLYSFSELAPQNLDDAFHAASAALLRKRVGTDQCNVHDAYSYP